MLFRRSSLLKLVKVPFTNAAAPRNPMMLPLSLSTVSPASVVDAPRARAPAELMSLTESSRERRLVSVPRLGRVGKHNHIRASDREILVGERKCARLRINTKNGDLIATAVADKKEIAGRI